MQTLQADQQHRVLPFLCASVTAYVTNPVSLVHRWHSQAAWHAFYDMERQQASQPHAGGSPAAQLALLHALELVLAAAERAMAVFDVAPLETEPPLGRRTTAPSSSLSSGALLL
jgi:hypothetical protein